MKPTSTPAPELSPNQKELRNIRLCEQRMARVANGLGDTALADEITAQVKYLDTVAEPDGKDVCQAMSRHDEFRKTLKPALFAITDWSDKDQTACLIEHFLWLIDRVRPELENLSRIMADMRHRGSKNFDKILAVAAMVNGRHELMKDHAVKAGLAVLRGDDVEYRKRVGQEYLKICTTIDALDRTISRTEKTLTKFSPPK